MTTRRFKLIPKIFLLFIILTGLDFCFADTNINSDKITPNWFQLGRPRLGLAALDKETVPVPWQPVNYSAAEQTATVWNRTYSFAGHALLSAVNCAGVNLLTSPVVLNIKVNGVSGSLTFAEPIVIADKTGKGRLVLQRTGCFSYVRAELTYTIEYDGLIWCELKLTIPQGSQRIEQLQLIISLKKDTAALTHYAGAPATYTSQNLPENSYSKELPVMSGNHYKSGLKTMVWVGNTTHGLLWCIESDQFWWPKDRKDCLRMDRRQDGSLEFTVDMVASLLPKAAPDSIEYSFGLMATPVKPRPQGWRGWTVSTQWDSCKDDHRGFNLFYWPDEYRFMSLDPDPIRYRNQDRTRKKIERDVSEGRYIIPYWTRLNICPKSLEQDPANTAQKITKINPDADLMLKEWGIIPNNPRSSKDAYYRLSANTAWADYLVWCVEGFATKMGHLDGVYLDEVQPVPNTRAESFGGYDSMDGIRRPTFEFFGTRNFIKRIAYNTYQRNKKRPRIIAHCSATNTLNSLSGCDMLLIGEQFNINYLRSDHNLTPPKSESEEWQYYYSYALPMDRMKAECFGRQWGEVVVWLPQLKGQPGSIMEDPVTTRDMLSRVMQGDMLVWPLWCNADEVHKTWRFRREFNIGSSEIEFIPYWENTAITVKPVKHYNSLQKSPEIVVGYYLDTIKNTYLVLVSNLSRYPVEIEMNFGVLTVKSVKDAETGAKLFPNDSGNLRLNLKRNDYKALRINH